MNNEMKRTCEPRSVFALWFSIFILSINSVVGFIPSIREQVLDDKIFENSAKLKIKDEEAETLRERIHELIMSFQSYKGEQYYEIRKLQQKIYQLEIEIQTKNKHGVK